MERRSVRFSVMREWAEEKVCKPGGTEYGGVVQLGVLSFSMCFLWLSVALYGPNFSCRRVCILLARAAGHSWLFSPPRPLSLSSVFFCYYSSPPSCRLLGGGAQTVGFLLFLFSLPRKGHGSCSLRVCEQWRIGKCGTMDDHDFDASFALMSMCVRVCLWGFVGMARAAAAAGSPPIPYLCFFLFLFFLQHSDIMMGLAYLDLNAADKKSTNEI